MPSKPVGGEVVEVNAPNPVCVDGLPPRLQQGSNSPRLEYNLDFSQSTCLLLCEFERRYVAAALRLAGLKRSHAR